MSIEPSTPRPSARKRVESVDQTGCFCLGGKKEKPVEEKTEAVVKGILRRENTEIVRTKNDSKTKN
jgi:hypothetical protein